MPVDDRTRLNLHRKLEAALGREETDALMAHLPPVTWNDVATKEGFATLGTSLRTEMQTLRAELRADFTEQMNCQIKWLVTSAAAWTSLLVTALCAARRHAGHVATASVQYRSGTVEPTDFPLESPRPRRITCRSTTAPD